MRKDFKFHPRFLSVAVLFSATQSLLSDLPASFDARLHFTAAVKESMTLRPSPGSEGIGLLWKNASIDSEISCAPKRIVEKNGASYIPIRLEGWVIDENLDTSRTFLRHNGTYAVVSSETLKARSTPGIGNQGTFKVEVGAKLRVLGASRQMNNYTWRPIEWTGWVTSRGSNGTKYTTSIEENKLGKGEPSKEEIDELVAFAKRTDAHIKKLRSELSATEDDGEAFAIRAALMDESSMLEQAVELAIKKMNESGNSKGAEELKEWNDSR